MVARGLEVQTSELVLAGIEEIAVMLKEVNNALDDELSVLLANKGELL